MLTKIPNPGYPKTEPAPREVTQSQRDKARDAAKLLDDGFSWMDSAEGFDFWYGVSRRLWAISRGEPLK